MPPPQPEAGPPSFTRSARRSLTFPPRCSIKDRPDGFSIRASPWPSVTWAWTLSMIGIAATLALGALHLASQCPTHRAASVCVQASAEALIHAPRSLDRPHVLILVLAGLAAFPMVLLLLSVAGSLLYRYDNPILAADFTARTLALDNADRTIPFDRVTAVTASTAFVEVCGGEWVLCWRVVIGLDDGEQLICLCRCEPRSVRAEIERRLARWPPA